MNEKSKKLVHYSTAAVALLAVSGGASAVVVPGTVMTEIDDFTFDNVLDHDNDVVLIDLNNDGEPDFVARMLSNSFYISASLYYNEQFVFIQGLSGNFIDLDKAFAYYSYPFVRKFEFNNWIGPLDNPFYLGVISNYSGGILPEALAPPTAPFNNSNDEGFIGIQMNNNGVINYGWIQVSVAENTESVEFISCALETAPGYSILAGDTKAVPLLPIASAAGLGLIGLMAAMKKRRN
jgi:hypothetical protein